MNSGLNEPALSRKQSSFKVWDKWLKATGVDHGYAYRVPVEVWDAAWNEKWPDLVLST